MEYPHRRVSKDDNDFSIPGTKRTVHGHNKNPTVVGASNAVGAGGGCSEDVYEGTDSSSGKRLKGSDG